MPDLAYAVAEEEIQDIPVTVLEAAGSDLRAAFAPGAGMVCASLRHHGDELLGQRGGLAKYAQTGSSMGIPLLHPWANRLSALEYSAAGRTVKLDPDRSPIRLDPNGLPIHGLAVAWPYWEVTGADASQAGARLSARLDWSAHDDLMAGFPFAHELTIEAILFGATLTIETVLHATGDTPVPVSFGWHPYLTLPDTPRADYDVTLPVRRQSRLDDRGIPTGEDEPVEDHSGPLGDRDHDDLFTELTHPPEFILRGADHCLELRFEAGYPHAQVYAPPADDFICFEPMTAPTNALVTGDHQLVTPGDRYIARFSITVTDG